MYDQMLENKYKDTLRLVLYQKTSNDENHWLNLQQLADWKENFTQV